MSVGQPFFWHRFRQTLLLLSATCLLAACATLSGPRQVDVPLARLQEGLSKRFPVEQRLFEVISLRLEQPRLSTLPAEERLQVTLAAGMSSPMMAQAWRGQLVFSGRLELDGTRQAIVLREGRVERLAADGLDESRQRLLARIANFVADHTLQDLVLHTFKADDLRYLGTQYTPIALRPTADALRMTLEPAHR